MDNSHDRLICHPGKMKKIFRHSGKEHLKTSKIAKWRNVVDNENYSPTKFRNLVYICITKSRSLDQDCFSSSSRPGSHSEPIAINPRERREALPSSYDVVSSSECSAAKPRSSQAANSGEDYIVVENRPGFASSMTTYRHFKRQRYVMQEHAKLDELRTGLLELINSALLNLADIAVDSVLGEILKFEYFLCFVNYPLARVRTLAVEVSISFSCCPIQYMIDIVVFLNRFSGKSWKEALLSSSHRFTKCLDFISWLFKFIDIRLRKSWPKHVLVYFSINQFQ